MTGPTARACKAAALLLATLGMLFAHLQHPKAEETAMRLHSPAFSNGSRIPSRYTCEGQDISPPLVWTGVPETARALALIVDDPDAPDPKAPSPRRACPRAPAGG